MRGLVAQKRSGHFGRTWWGRQVERALEEPYRGYDGTIKHPQVTRAKALARNGAILAMEHHGTTVAGEIQGSQLSPFAPVITCAAFDAETVERVRTAISEHPGAAEQIIAGTLPAFLEQLLPLAPHDLRCTCTCPAIEQRCTHTLALGYLLVERMDRDVEWYLAFRGLELSKILVATDPLEDPTVNSALQGATTSHTVPRGKAAQAITRPTPDDPRRSTPQNAAPHRTSVEEKAIVAVQDEVTAPRSLVALDPYHYWHLSGELPQLPAPLPNPAYRDLDPVQWMAAATAFTSDPVDKLTMESDLHDAWDYLTDPTSEE